MQLPSVLRDIFRYSVSCCCLLTIVFIFTSGSQVYFLLREYFIAYIFISPYLPAEVGRICSIVEASRSPLVTGVGATNVTEFHADSSAITYLEDLTTQPLVIMPPAPDIIELLNAPVSVTAGETIYLSVKYNVSAYRLLICDLLSKDDYKQFATGKVHVDRPPIEQSQYMTASGERGRHAVIPVQFHLNAAPAAGTRYILQLWSVDPEVYDKDPSVAWHHWTAHTAYDVAVSSDYSLLPHIMQQRVSSHQSIGVDCVSVSHLIKTFNTSGTGVIIATYRKTNHQQTMYVIADLLDAADNRFTKHGTGFGTIGSSHVAEKDADVVGETSVTVYLSSGTSTATNPNAQHVLSVWLIDANTYDTIMERGGDDAANLWRHAVDHHVYPVGVAEGGYSPGNDWQMIWNDEFDGAAVDQSNWSFEYGNGEGGWGNNELQEYTDTNVYLENSQLVIVARREGRRYTSARLKTQGKRNFTHGKIAGRLKAPRGKGFWPAFWMLGESISTVSWPQCGELDIMELVGENSPDNVEDCTVYFNTHWQSNDNHQHLHYGTKMHLPQSKYSSNWHIFECEWNAQYVIGRMDGVEYYRMNIAARDDTQQLQRGDPMFILLNLAIGGWWPGSPRDDTPFPQEYRIDWIRAYKYQPNSGHAANSNRQHTAHVQQVSINPPQHQQAAPATAALSATATSPAGIAMPPAHPSNAANHKDSVSSASSPERPSAIRQASPFASPIKPDYKPQSSLGRSASNADTKPSRHSRLYSRSATADEEAAMFRSLAAQAEQEQQLSDSERMAVDRRKEQLFALYPAMTELDYYRFEQFVNSEETAQLLWQRQLTELDSQVLQTLMIRSKEHNGTNWQKMKSFLGIR